MNISLDGRQVSIETFFADTYTTLFNRVAWFLNTLPELLYIPDYQGLDSVQEQQVYTPVDMWRLAKQADTQLDTLLEMYPERFDRNTIIQLWAIYHPQEFSVYRTINSDFERNETSLIRTIETNGPSFLNNLREKRSVFKRKQNTILSTLKSLHSIPSFPSTDFDASKQSIRVRFQWMSCSLLDLLNRMRTSTNIPFITHNDYYKVLNHFTPPVNWSSSDEWLNAKLLVDGDYLDIRIYSEDTPGTFTMHVPSNPVYDATSVFQMMTQHIDNMVVNANVLDQSESRVGTSFAFNINIDNNVFADLLLTSTHLPEFISVNDNIQHVAPSGARDLYFANPYDTTTSLRASISTKIAAVNDIFPVNTLYTQVSISRTSSETLVLTFKTLMEKVMTLYKDMETSITSFYTSYGLSEEPSTSIRPSRTKRKMFRKDANPILFESSKNEIYTRRCQKRQQPIVIPPEEIDDEKRQVLQFPKPEDSNIAPPEYYVCPDDTYKYPGLIRFGNALGVAPCCFKTNQTNKRIYKEYYENLQNVPIPVEQPVSYFITTNKIVEKGNYGFFPTSRSGDTIGQLFERIQPVNTIIFRQGIDRSPDSFLDCIVTALDLPVGNDRQQYLAQQRERMVDKAVLARQEMYDYDVYDIQTFLMNQSAYLDPLKTIRIVEELYQCSILLFVKDGDSGMITPARHTNGYCSTQRYPRSVFVYCHQGSETDDLPYPHCELIVAGSTDQVAQLKSRTPTALQKTWDSGIVYSVCWSIHDKLISYAFGKYRPLPRARTLVQLLSIQSQSIDRNGKVRTIKCLFNRQPIVLETSPLAPLDVPEEVLTPSVLEQDIVNTFFETYSLTDMLIYDIETNDGSTYTQYIQGWYGASFYLRFYIAGLQYYITDAPSVYSTFVNNDKIARYLTQWMMYTFSWYISENNIEEISQTTIRDFVNENIVVDSSYTYDPSQVSALFNPDLATGILQNDQIVCSSDELLKRLVYQLRLLIERNRKQISTYKDKTCMDRYYTSINDFEQRATEHVLYIPKYSTTQLLDLLYSSNEKTLFSSLDADSIGEPYFISHPVVTNGNVVLAQNTEEVDDAVNRGISWSETGVNPDQVLSTRQDVSFYIYYKNKSKDWAVAQVGSEPVRDNLTLFGNKKTFTPLMDL